MCLVDQRAQTLGFLLAVYYSYAICLLDQVLYSPACVPLLPGRYGSRSKSYGKRQTPTFYVGNPLEGPPLKEWNNFCRESSVRPPEPTSSG